MHKVATVLMWISWVLFFVAMLGAGNFFLVGEKLILVMLYILGVAAVGLLLSFSLFSLISFKLKNTERNGMAVILNRWIPHYVLASFDETLLLRGIKCKKARVMVQ